MRCCDLVRMWDELREGGSAPLVEYSPGYSADHWCSKGHVVLCLEGEFETILSDGRCFTMTPGKSYQVADGETPHRSSSKRGAMLFIVD